MMTISAKTGVRSADSQESLTDRQKQLAHEFENMLWGLVLATGANDRPRMLEKFERIKGRYLKALTNVSLDTIGRKGDDGI